MSLARLSVRNPVPVNLLMIAILALGALSFFSLPRELMSDISFQWVFITKVYPGVTAEEIEKLITVPIEDEIRNVKGIDYIASRSTAGVAVISVKFQQMSDEEFRAHFQDLRAEVDQVKDLPADALDTEVMSFGSADFVPLIAVNLYGQVGDKKLIELARQFREELLAIPKVSKVEIMGLREREVWVEADPTKLHGYALSPEQLRMAIGAEGLNIPAGQLSVGRKELLVRTIGEFGDLDEISKVIVRTTPAGKSVRVGDVARVKDTFKEERTRSQLDGEPALSLTVTKQNGGNSIAITDEVKRMTKEFEKKHGALLRAAITQDSSEQINDMLDKLSTNAWLGFAVVVLILMIVLGLRNAVLAGMGIPICFLACFIFMHYSGETFNSNSLFGLVLVLGIIVDDAIVIVENCHRHLQLGKSWKEAAIVGTEEVLWPVFAATATTVAAFLPLILLPGIVGKFMRIVPITVSLALAASLVEAFVILPSHFAEWPGRRMSAKTEKPWLTQLKASYERKLRAIVRRRRLMVVLVLLLIPAAASIIPLVGVDMFAGEEANNFQVRVTMPAGTNLDTTMVTLGQFERVAAQLPQGEVRSIQATAGFLMTDTEWIHRTDVGQLWLDLPMSYARQRTSDEIMADLRARLKDIPGPMSIELAKRNTGPPLGKPIEVKVRGKYLPQLQQAVQALKAHLETMTGVYDLSTDFQAGKEEIRFQVDAKRASLYGLSTGQVGQAIRTALDGEKTAKMYDGDEEIDVLVKVDRRFFVQPEDLLRLPLLLPLPEGKSVTLGDVASYTIKPSIATVRRYRNQRTISLYGQIDKKTISIIEVNKAIKKKFAELSPRFPGVTLGFTGEYQEFKESFTSLAQLFLFGVLLIYVILGAQFRSYIQPVVILFTVPFSFIGAMVGLLISGNPFSVVTLFGMVALAGIAVNDAIVLISFTNDARAKGTPAEEAIIQAGKLRLRPILLTSLTTIAGLLPMAMGLGGMSLTWGPLANTIVWGLVVSTILTLFLIPSLYLVFVHDLPRLFCRWRGGAVEP